MGLYINFRYIPKDTPNKLITEPLERAKFKKWSLLYLISWVTMMTILLFFNLKIIVIASVILICIIIILLLVSQKKSTTSTSSNSPFPTSISLQKSNQQNSQLLNSDSASLTGTENNNQNLSDSSTENNNQGLTNLPIDNVDQNLSDPSFDISTIAPVETEDFRLQYSSKK